MAESPGSKRLEDPPTVLKNAQLNDLLNKKAYKNAVCDSGFYRRKARGMGLFCGDGGEKSGRVRRFPNHFFAKQEKFNGKGRLREKSGTKKSATPSPINYREGVAE